MATPEQEREAEFLTYVLDRGGVIREAGESTPRPVGGPRPGLALRESTEMFPSRRVLTPRRAAPRSRDISDVKLDLPESFLGDENDRIAEQARAKYRLQKLLPAPAPKRPAVTRIKNDLLAQLGR